jgi:hypothetical protein
LTGIQSPVIIVRYYARRAQVVAQQPLRVCRPRAHRHPLCTGVVVLHHRGGAALPLEVVTDVNGGRPTFGSNHPLPVAVVSVEPVSGGLYRQNLLAAPPRQHRHPIELANRKEIARLIHKSASISGHLEELYREILFDCWLGENDRGSPTYATKSKNWNAPKNRT